ERRELRLAAHVFLELLGRQELRKPPLRTGRDLDRLTGERVLAHAGLAGRLDALLKPSEAAEGNLLATLDGVLDRPQRVLVDLLDLLAGHAGPLGDGLEQLRAVQGARLCH